MSPSRAEGKFVSGKDDKDNVFLEAKVARVHSTLFKSLKDG